MRKNIPGLSRVTYTDVLWFAGVAIASWLVLTFIVGAGAVIALYLIAVAAALVTAPPALAAAYRFITGRRAP